MDKIEKALLRLNKKERDAVEIVLARIKAGDLAGIDVVKMKGRDDIFRVRKGKIRIIFQKGAKIQLIAVERRSDTTYNF